MKITNTDISLDEMIEILKSRAEKLKGASLSMKVESETKLKRIREILDRIEKFLLEDSK